MEAFFFIEYDVYYCSTEFEFMEMILLIIYFLYSDSWSWINYKKFLSIVDAAAYEQSFIVAFFFPL